MSLGIWDLWCFRGRLRLGPGVISFEDEKEVGGRTC